MTDHPKPFGTDLQNYKQVREEIILSFNPAQQSFLRKHRWAYRREKLNTKVKLLFHYYFTGIDDTTFRLLFSEYKSFNYCRATDSFFNTSRTYNTEVM